MASGRVGVPGRAAIVVSAVVVLAGCAAPRAPVTSDTRADDLPHAQYEAAVARGAPVYRIDSSASEVLIFVYRDGPLARFGHDHIVASHDVTGYILWSDAPDVARADLRVPLATLTVDETGLRAAAGFDTTPSDDDVVGTRNNMLASLDATAFPVMRISVTRQGDQADVSLQVEITLHGVTRSFPVTVDLERGEDWLRINGSFAVLQSDFRITPYSILGGALSVRDRLDVRFRLAGRRTDAGLPLAQPDKPPG